MFLLHGFSPIPITSFNFFLALAAFPICMSRPLPAGYSYEKSNILVFVLSLWGVIAWIFYKAPVEEGRIQGLLWWLASFYILWLGVRRWILISRVSFDEISRTSFYAIISISTLVIIEFVLVNTRHVYFSDFLPFAAGNFPSANLFTASLFRPRVFAAEAGFTSMVLELLIPLSIPHFRQVSRSAKAAFVSVCILALVLLFSTTTFLAAGVAIALLQAIRLNHRGFVIFTVVLLLAAYVIIINSDFFFSIAGYKIAAFFDTLNYSHSSGTRQEALSAGFQLLMDKPFGIGWGTVLQEAKTSGSMIDDMIAGTGLINLWLELGVATGVVGAMAFGAFIISTLVDLARSSRSEAHLCFLSLCMLTIHHFGVYEVWFPMFWFALALSQVVLKADELSGERDVAPTSAGRQGWPLK